MAVTLAAVLPAPVTSAGGRLARDSGRRVTRVGTGDGLLRLRGEGVAKETHGQGAAVAAQEDSGGVDRGDRWARASAAAVGVEAGRATKRKLTDPLDAAMVMRRQGQLTSNFQ